MDFEDFVKSIDRKKVKKYSIISLITIFSLIVFLNSFRVIGAGEIGIVTRFGDVQRTADSGLMFKIPFIEQVTTMDTRIQKEEVTSSAVTKDLQDMKTTLALNYSIDKNVALKLYKEVGVNYKDNIINPVLHESVKAGTAQYNAEAIITNRSEVKEKILEVVKDRLQPYGITVNDFNITDLDFSSAFNAAIEAKAVAQQEVEKAKQELEKTKIEAEQKIAKAQAEAEAQRLQQQTLTDLMIKKMWIEKWNGQLPTTATDASGLMLNIGE